MITQLSVRNFQSLHVVDLELKPFTVIVGPSSSGKSALVRALRTLTANARGSSFVSTWAKRTVISADLEGKEEPKGTVILTRSAKTEDNHYVIKPPPGPNEDAPESMFTKLGGEVPPEVSSFLGIVPKDPLHFAGQFDKPFLLDDSPGEVARTLAGLTKVETVFSAAREANRVRLGHSSTLKTRQHDLAVMQAKATSFSALKTQLPAIQRSEAALRQARDLASSITNLSVALSKHSEALEARKRATETLKRSVPSLTDLEDLLMHSDGLQRALRGHAQASLRKKEAGEVLERPVPSLEDVVGAMGRRNDFLSILQKLKAGASGQKTSATAILVSEQELHQAEHTYQEALVTAGTCPTCGQPVGGNSG